MEALRIKIFCTLLSWMMAVVLAVFQFFGENLFRILHCYLEIPLIFVCIVISTFFSVRLFYLMFHPLFAVNFWELFFKFTVVTAILIANIKFPIFYYEWIISALYNSIDIKSDQLWLLIETAIQTYQIWFCLDCYIDIERIEFECLERHVKIKQFGKFAIELDYLSEESVKRLLNKQQKIRLSQGS